MGCGYKGLVFCRNNGKHGQGTRSTRMGADRLNRKYPKYPRIYLPKPKIFQWKASLGVRSAWQKQDKLLLAWIIDFKKCIVLKRQLHAERTSIAYGQILGFNICLQIKFYQCQPDQCWHNYGFLNIFWAINSKNIWQRWKMWESVRVDFYSFLVSFVLL